MGADKYIFKRKEKKYVLSSSQFEQLITLIKPYITEDEYPSQTVHSIYLDTPSFLLIRNSIDAKKYKEKIRLRGYGTVENNSKVFLELKKKLNGIVYKRRLSLPLNVAEEYIQNGIVPDSSQIMQEIEAFMRFYNRPKPKIAICCERLSFIAKDDKNLRITFDTNIRYRFDNLSLTHSPTGTPLLSDGECVMEIKVLGAMPLWLTKCLDECKIYPQSFSKYGKAHLKQINEKK